MLMKPKKNNPSKIKTRPTAKANTRGGNKKTRLPESLRQVNLNAAGIDVHPTELWVAVPSDRDTKPVRRFGTFTSDLEQMADWLLACGLTTVAMESTGIYWIPPFQVLERRGLDMKLVNARHVKNVTGRKGDISDCQWLQQLHTFGLLRNSFRPTDQVCVLRSYLRLRDELMRARSRQILHLQKALHQMNVQLHHVLSDITGASGQAILRAIVEGQRDPVKLAAMVDKRVRASQDKIARALAGDYREEHLFALQIALELYDEYTRKITTCDERILAYLSSLESKVDLKEKPLPAPKASLAKKAKSNPTSQGALEVRAQIYRVSGVDLTAIEGIGAQTAQIVMSEIGWDLSRFPSEKHFTSWLALCPDHRISAGKILSRQTRHAPNRAANALRLAASTLEQSPSALGNYFRRMKGKLGATSAITATAHKLARIVYRLIKHGEAYVTLGQQEEEQRYRERRLYNLRRNAARLGFELVERQGHAKPVS